MSEIVLGLDVSEASRAALAWAAAHARLTGADLRAVHALMVPASVVAAVGSMSAPVTNDADDRVEQSYRDAVTAVWESVQPEPGWRLEFYRAEARGLLMAESARADLLVIGTRDHVGWGRILNGSVSHYCLSHAPCPVVAVPAGIRSTPASDPPPVEDPQPETV